METIIKYFPNLSAQQIKQFSRLQALYEDWNSKINVISRKDMENFYLHHVLHSLGIAKFIDFESRSKILDVGTGGGFPGIPLAILFPEVEFHLVDSIGKKIKVVNEVSSELMLRNVLGEQKRAEEIKGKYDFIVSRAVTVLPEFVSWIKGNISNDHFNAKANGILYLKGGDVKEEIKSVRYKSDVFKLNKVFDEDFFETKQVVHLW
jgi:16S rRNA (guanine527-N7)-methyltransferase